MDLTYKSSCKIGKELMSCRNGIIDRQFLLIESCFRSYVLDIVIPLKVWKDNYIKVFEGSHFLDGLLKDGQIQRSITMFTWNGHNIGLFAVQSKPYSIYLHIKATKL